MRIGARVYPPEAPDREITVTFNPEGIYSACVTPFRSDESLDLDRLTSHIDWQLDAGIDGMMIAGGCGEYANLTPTDRRQVVEHAVKVVDGRAPVLVGALAPSTWEVVEDGKHAASVGADALLVLPPYYIKPSFDGVIQHFETIANETGLPVVAYNNPGRTGWPLGLDHMQRIAEIPGVVAMKECERDMANISLKILAVNDRMPIMSGDDDLCFATFLSGSRGAVMASANLCPKLCVDLFAACVKGDVETALALHNRLVTLFSAWMLPNHPGPLKEAMTMVGRGVGPARAPLAKLTKEQADNLKAALNANGPIE